MAKVTDFKFKIKDESYVVHVNCNSSGEFSANLPKDVAEALDLRPKMIATSLIELDKTFHAALDKYRTAETTQELLIAMRYKAQRAFAKDAKGEYLFHEYRNPYEMDMSFDYKSNAMAFTYHIFLKETVDGKVSIYETRKIIHDEGPVEYRKEGSPKTYDIDKFKMIPFTQVAIDTLDIAIEKIRRASEQLFHFIEQDEETIALTLNTQPLLTNE